MKDLVKFSVLVVLITTMCSSCGSKITEVTVKNKSTEIQGDLNNYLEIVEGSYKILMAGNDLILNIKLRAIKKLEEPNLDEIRAELLDKSDMPLVGVGTFNVSHWNSSNDIDKINDALKKGSGEIAIQLIYSSWGNKCKESEALKIASEKAKSFSIISKVKENTSYNSSDDADDTSIISNDDEDDNKTTSKNSSKNWDKVLSDYESYTNQYIKLLKKANAGDISAMTEYVNMLQKAQDIQESLSDANDEMTPAQLQRFMRIQEKLINAASGM